MKPNKHDDMCPCTRFRAQDEFCQCGAVEREEIVKDTVEAFGRRLREIIQNPTPPTHLVGIDQLARAFQAGFTGGNATWDEAPEHHKEQFREGVRSLIADGTSRDQKLPGDTITLTPAEAWSLFYNDPKDVRARTTMRMAVWLDGLRFNPATAAPEASHD